VVTGVTAGTSVITYTTGAGCFKTKIVTVNAIPNASGGYKIACIGLTTSLTNVSGGTWTSGDTTIAKATSSGTTSIITGMSAGTANITFTLTSTGCYRVTEVTVNPVPPAITGTANVCVSLQTTLSNTLAGGSWSSSNSAIASIGSTTGVVTAAAFGGQATISYSFGANCRVTTVVTVRPIPNVISGPASLCIGTTTTFTTTTLGGAWSSSNTAAATVVTGSASNNGAVTAVAGGVTTLSYTIAPSCSRTLTVTVAACRAGNPTTGVDNIQDADVVSVYPNPTNGTFTLNTQQDGIFYIYSLEGRELARQDISAASTVIDMPKGIAVGVYMARFVGKDGNETMVRLIYQQ
jgi:uncharacterized protein YjdB